jgi:hypothetical protein
MVQSERLTDVALYEQYILLCAQNISSATSHLDDTARDIWLRRFMSTIHFMYDLGYEIKGQDVFHLSFVR